MTARPVTFRELGLGDTVQVGPHVSPPLTIYVSTAAPLCTNSANTTHTNMKLQTSGPQDSKRTGRNVRTHLNIDGCLILLQLAD